MKFLQDGVGSMHKVFFSPLDTPRPRGPRSRDASPPSAASGTLTHVHLPQIPFQTQLPLGGCTRACSVMSDSATPWAGARQAPLSMEFSRQESWSGLPFPPPGDFPNPGIEPLMSPALAGGFFTTKPPGKPIFREKAMPKGIGVSGFVEKVIPFPGLSPHS